MKRGGRLQRSKPLKQRRRPKRSQAEVEAAELWRSDLGPCMACRFEGLECAGRIDPHHLIPAQALKRRNLHAYLYDRRNRFPLCRKRHDLVTRAMRPLSRSLIPLEAWAFAEELDLTWLLERMYE